jgi:hypothetical protein
METNQQAHEPDQPGVPTCHGCFSSAQPLTTQPTVAQWGLYPLAPRIPLHERIAVRPPDSGSMDRSYRGDRGGRGRTSLQRPEGCIYSDRWPHQRFSPSRLVGQRGPGGSVWPDNVEKTGDSPGPESRNPLHEIPGHGPDPSFVPHRSGSPIVAAEAEKVERTRRKT